MGIVKVLPMVVEFKERALDVGFVVLVFDGALVEVELEKVELPVLAELLLITELIEMLEVVPVTVESVVVDWLEVELAAELVIWGTFELEDELDVEGLP